MYIYNDSITSGRVVQWIRRPTSNQKIVVSFLIMVDLLFLIHSSLEHIVTALLRRMLNHGPLESMDCTVLTVFRKHLGTYIVYLQ